jgi:hypothetical protein
MSEDQSEQTLLLEESHDLCEEIDGGIDELRRLRPRFQHVWPADFELEPSSRRVARIRAKLSDEIELDEARQLVKLLEIEKAEIVRRIAELGDSERKDRSRYRA